MNAFVYEWLTATWDITLEAAPYLLGGFLIAGLIRAWIPMDKIAAHLGRPSFSGVLKAALVGVPLPLCSCSVIPVASSIRRSGASRGATAGFLISTPETGVDSISITYALLGPVMAVLRPVAALLSAVTAGLLINRFEQRSTAESQPNRDEDGATDTAHSCCKNQQCHPVANAPTSRLEVLPSQNSSAEISASASTESSPPQRTAGIINRLRIAIRYGYVDMFADLAVWLAIGFALAGLISAVVPDDFLQAYIGSGLLAMLLVLAMALPFYVCATSSTPIAAALMAKGLSPGTALVFLLVGPATNIATMLVVARDLGRRSLLIYLVSIGFVAIVLGVAVDLLLVVPLVEGLYSEGPHHAHSIWTVVAGIAFVALIVNGLRLRYLHKILPASMKNPIEPHCEQHS